MAQTPEPSAEHRKGKLIVEVPRIPEPSDAPDVSRPSEGDRGKGRVRTEPEVSSYDGRPSAFGGPMSNPQGYFFAFDLTESED